MEMRSKLINDLFSSHHGQRYQDPIKGIRDKTDNLKNCTFRFH